MCVLVCTSCTRDVQENVANGLVVLQSAEILGLIICDSGWDFVPYGGNFQN